MMLFHYKQRNMKKNLPKLKINGIDIERVKEFNFLGVTIRLRLRLRNSLFGYVNFDRHDKYKNTLETLEVTKARGLGPPNHYIN